MNHLENIKRDNIFHLSNYEWFPNWESFLTSDYWKSWRKKISAFQTEKELGFYRQRLREIADLICRCKKYADDGDSDDLLIKQEEKRLENISEEDWKREYKFANVSNDLKAMEAEEIDKNFGKDIDRFFGSSDKKNDNNPNSRTKDQDNESCTTKSNNNQFTTASLLIVSVVFGLLVTGLIVYKLKRFKEVK